MTYASPNRAFSGAVGQDPSRFAKALSNVAKPEYFSVPGPHRLAA